jgi:hypothetical protein
LRRSIFRFAIETIWTHECIAAKPDFLKTILTIRPSSIAGMVEGPNGREKARGLLAATAAAAGGSRDESVGPGASWR